MILVIIHGGAIADFESRNATLCRDLSASLP
jgi:hypothetical protein